ncbi:MAG: addiction module toxin, HicA family [Chloroflexaceae bacterium]|nr:addiction module toxin, HicA family [Chloroflexaceae bacterium]NJO04620.1 addiction module toxin, HicA family [Chloroflexaceae bacterium]
MTKKLPALSGNECVKALEKSGFYFKRQEGSHKIMRRDSPYCQVTVPEHRTLAPGTLRAIIRAVGLTVEEFVDLLDD